ncbi:hypothetical protein OC846_001302 [Tilletia horrida]|uniref:CS domain-containing protein n=1 Tax=Tilletia horrida TaxID=155126 RepID=A0AAN6GZ52_9BASI|nr:hypothetical protein OC845_001244 [Tilletia horrida]KAK0556208.1 hypothetical protein OC846_001302 [Tilletia horrida]KAK0569129.1 hypothetical protein OC861_001269 [Tilletia horrida]
MATLHPAFSVWTVHQSTSQATVLFYVPRRTRSSDLEVRIGKDSIIAGIKDQPPVINASLWAAVHPETSSWQIERTSKKQRKSHHRSSSHSRPPPRQSPPPLDGQAPTSRLNSAPASSSAFSHIASDIADSGSESEAESLSDVAGASSGSGYISQPEDGSHQRRRLPRFDPSATRSFSSRSKIIPFLAEQGASGRSGSASSRAVSLSPTQDAAPLDFGRADMVSGATEHAESEGNMASSIASLPARLSPPSPNATRHPVNSATASRLASRTASTASFSSLGSGSYEMNAHLTDDGSGEIVMHGPISTIGSSISSLNSDIRRARSIQAGEDLTLSQDSFLNVGSISSRGSNPRSPRLEAATYGGAAEPTPMAERDFSSLLPSASAPERPPLEQAKSNESSGSGSGSVPSSELSGSLMLPNAKTPSVPASTSATSTSSGFSASSLSGARLVTIYLDKVQPEIWPVLISGPAPLPPSAEDSSESPEREVSLGSLSELPPLDEQHARSSLRMALQEALSDARAATGQTRRRDSEAERSSIFTVGSDDSDTVLGARFPPADSETTTADGTASQDAEARISAERRRRAEERSIWAKFNLDPTSLVLLGLQSRARIGDRLGGVDEAFQYFVRAWRAALSPVATCRLVEDYLPLPKPRRKSIDASSGPDIDADRIEADLPIETEKLPDPGFSSSPREEPPAAEPGTEMDRLQHSSDTLRSPKLPSTNAHSTADVPSTAFDNRSVLISALGGSNALGRLYLSYARLHLEVALEKWTSPLAFPGEAGQLHGPYTRAAGGAGTASPNVGSVGGGGTSPGGILGGVGQGLSAPPAGLGLGYSSANRSRADMDKAYIRDGGRAPLPGRSDKMSTGSGPPGSYARSNSSATSGRSGSQTRAGAPPSTERDQTSILIFASHERERVLRHRPGPLAYMQAAVRLDPTLAYSSESDRENETSFSRFIPLLPGESGPQAWRVPMSIDEDEWLEARDVECERRNAIQHEIRYRASLKREAVPHTPWRPDASSEPGTGTATPTTSSVPPSEASNPVRHTMRYSLGPDEVEFGRSVRPRRNNQHRSSGSGDPAAASSRRKAHSRRHGRPSLRRGPSSNLPLISEEGMINIMSGAAVLSVVVAGSVAVMSWWRRVGGTTVPPG